MNEAANGQESPEPPLIVTICSKQMSKNNISADSGWPHALLGAGQVVNAP